MCMYCRKDIIGKIIVVHVICKISLICFVSCCGSVFNKIYVFYTMVEAVRQLVYMLRLRCNMSVLNKEGLIIMYLMLKPFLSANFLTVFERFGTLICICIDYILLACYI